MAATEEITHVQIIEWVIGVIALIGGALLGIVGKMVRGKKNRAECDLIHHSLTEKLDGIKDDLKDSKTKMDSMGNILVEISTTLKLKSQDETDRYMRHSENWKKE